MIDASAPLVAHCDEYVRLMRPSYLTAATRVEHQWGVGYGFSPRPRKQSGLESIVLSVLSSGHAETRTSVKATRGIILSTRSWDSALSTITCLRRGKAPLRRGGVEMVAVVEHKQGRRPGVPLYEWWLLYPVDGGFVELRIHGTGAFAEDEPRWTDVVKSVEVNRCAPDPGRLRELELAEKRRRVRRSAGKKAARLRKALRAMPSDLHYLIDALVDLAAQPAEDLESADADTCLLEAALRESSVPPDQLARQAAELELWLSKSPTLAATDVGAAVQFAAGWLLGAKLFAPGDEGTGTK